MGRIDEALRRGGQLPRVDIASGAGSPAAEAFVSPWAFREGAELPIDRRRRRLEPACRGSGRSV